MTAQQLYEALSDSRTDVADAAVPAGGSLELPREEREFDLRMSRRLASVEQLLLTTCRDVSDPRFADLTGHLAANGGKRLRPLLVLLGAEFADCERAGVERAAVAAELVHLASLYHDDVVDEAATRHGAATANRRWGNRMAVLGGTWLLARTAGLAAGLVPGALALNADTADRLVAGQLRELVGPLPGEPPVEYYFQVTAGKTAALLSMSLRMGALQAGAQPEAIAALVEYGEQIGIAFQIADDILDLAPSEAGTGKERGKDLLAGVHSLPVLLAREDSDPRGARLRALLEDGPAAHGVEWHGRVLDLFARSRAVERAVALMHERLERARKALAPLPPLPARGALDALCDFVAARAG
ncbi:polyprenyl synthetase family protein [Streptomyces tardus]|nr:polyprenyl synthetase family protein [Streptomyces tardus]